MSESENRAANWTMGLVGSIALHVVVIGLFVTLGGSESASEPDLGDAASPSNVASSDNSADLGDAASRRVNAPTTDAKIYVVQRGDNASRIARQHNLTLQELARLNGTTIQKLGGIAVGQKLKLAE